MILIEHGWRRLGGWLVLLTLLLMLAAARAAEPRPLLRQATYYVATSGSDIPSAGSAAQPWASITYALTQVPDGSLILVKPGSYSGQVRLDRAFTVGVTVRAEQPYQAQLRHSATVVRSFYGQHITLEGFDIAHSGPGAAALVIQIQDLIDEPGGANTVSDIVLRNNIIHDSYNNDLLKINNGASHITVEGNMFYNQTGSDEHIDINSVTDVSVQDNIFFNDFAGSGRQNDNDTSAYIVVKDSNGSDDTNLGSARVTIQRNVMLNWEGSLGYGFIQLGEDGTANFEARDVLIENNLLLGNAGNTMRAPIAAMGVRDVLVRHNTIVGDLPSNAFALRLYTVAANQPNENLQFYNNIWADTSGSMSDFADAPAGETASFTLRHNLYWNNAAALPNDPTDMVNIADDPEALTGDPALGSQVGLVVPRWQPQSSQFADGSTTIRQAFELLVTSYGALGAGSVAADAARAAQSPSRDILGHTRLGGPPDVGAYERDAGTPPQQLFLPYVGR